MKTLRQLMIDEIKLYEYLDYSYKRGDLGANQQTYEQWLCSLSDSDFLWRYKDVSSAIDRLD